MGNALASFRGLEIDPFLNTGQATPAGQSDVQGNIAYFNTLFVGSTKLGGPVQINTAGANQPNNDTPFGTANTWFDVPFAFPNNISMPNGGSWILWATVTVQNTGASPINIQHRIVASDVSSIFTVAEFSVIANGFGSNIIMVEVSTFPGSAFKTQLNVSANTGVVKGNTFQNSMGPMIIGLQIGP